MEIHAGFCTIRRLELKCGLMSSVYCMEIHAGFCTIRTLELKCGLMSSILYGNPCRVLHYKKTRVKMWTNVECILYGNPCRVLHYHYLKTSYNVS